MQEHKIPKLTLQPIVENAIYHGLEMKSGKGHIHISTSIERNMVRICVEDNGIGITEEDLSALRKKLEEDKEDGKHSGLTNVHLRARLEFGCE